MKHMNSMMFSLAMLFASGQVYGAQMSKAKSNNTATGKSAEQLLAEPTQVAAKLANEAAAKSKADFNLAAQLDAFIDKAVIICCQQLGQLEAGDEGNSARELRALPTEELPHTQFKNTLRAHRIIFAAAVALYNNECAAAFNNAPYRVLARHYTVGGVFTEKGTKASKTHYIREELNQPSIREVVSNEHCDLISQHAAALFDAYAEAMKLEVAEPCTRAQLLHSTPAKATMAALSALVVYWGVKTGAVNNMVKKFNVIPAKK